MNHCSSSGCPVHAEADVETGHSDAVFADLISGKLCSNLGDVGSVVGHLDGTEPEDFSGRATTQHVTVSRRANGRRNGPVFWTLGGKVFITVVAYGLVAMNTKPALRELDARTLAEFDLTGENPTNESSPCGLNALQRPRPSGRRASSSVELASRPISMALVTGRAYGT